MSEPAWQARTTVPAGADDPSIPVLTERLTLPELELDFTLPPAPSTVSVTVADEPEPAPITAPAPAAAPAIEAESALASAGPATQGAHWKRIEIELRESILAELAQRLPQDVESIVRQQMATAIDAAVNRLAQEARLALATSLRDIVDRAVRAELERLRAMKR